MKQNICFWYQPHFLVFNKVPNIRQHNFETNKGLVFDYALQLTKFWSSVYFPKTFLFAILDGPVYQMECHSFLMIKYSPLHVLALPIMSIKVLYRSRKMDYWNIKRHISYAIYMLLELWKVLLHNNISYLLELVGKTNPDVFQQFVKDVVPVEVNNLWKLDHQSLFRYCYYTCKYMHAFIHNAYITILFD